MSEDSHDLWGRFPFQRPIERALAPGGKSCSHGLPWAPMVVSLCSSSGIMTLVLLSILSLFLFLGRLEYVLPVSRILIQEKLIQLWTEFYIK